MDKPLYHLLVSTLLALITLPSLALTDVKDVNFELEPAGPWVTPTQYTAKPFAQLNAPTHFHLSDVQYSVEAAESYFRFVYTITDPAGMTDSSNLTFRFNPAFEALTIHQVNVIRRGKVIQQISRDDVKLVNAEQDRQSQIFSGQVDAIVLLKGIKVGDVIDYSYSLTGRNPVFGNHFTAEQFLGWQVTVDKASVRVVTPKDRPIHYKTLNLKTQVKESKKGDYISYSLELENTLPQVDEDMVPSWFISYPYVQFSEYKDWNHVATWAAQLFELKHPLGESYQEELKRLKKLPSTEALNQAIDFVQNEIRYLGLSLAENSHKPHAPSEVLESRFGDCKDKSLLLTQLLVDLGFEANVALVSSQRSQSLPKFLPSHAVFNHAIVALKQGRETYWVDPTMSHQAKELTHKFQPDYKYALLVSKESKELAPTTIDSNNKIFLSEEIKAIDYFSPVELTVQTEFHGSEAERLRFKLAQIGKEKLANQYLNYYGRRYPKISSLQAMEVVDDADTNQLTISEHYLVPDFWTLNDEQSAEFKLVADFPNDYLRKPQTVIRKQPLWIASPIEIQHQVEFTLPEDIDFSALIFTEQFKDQHIEFESAFDYDRRKVRYSTQLLVKQSYVKSADVPDYLALMTKAHNYMSYSGSITNVLKDPSKDSMINLANSLNEMRLNKPNQQGL